MWRYLVLSLGPIASTKQYGGALQHAECIIEPAGIKGYGKNSMQTTKIRKIKAALWSHYNIGTRIQDRGPPSQLGGPSTEGPADYSPTELIL